MVAEKEFRVSCADAHFSVGLVSVPIHHVPFVGRIANLMDSQSPIEDTSYHALDRRERLEIEWMVMDSTSAIVDSITDLDFGIVDHRDSSMDPVIPNNSVAFASR